MTRARTALLLLLLLLPTQVWAKGLTAADGMRYLDRVRELRVELDWHPRGSAQGLFNATHIRITGIWSRAGAGQPALLRWAKIEAPSGPRLQLPGNDRRLRSITVDAKGKLRAMLNGVVGFDIGVQRTASGGLALDLPLWLKNQVITPEQLGGRLNRWPPSLDDLVRLFSARLPKPHPSGFQGSLRWKLTGKADPFAFPLPAGEVVAASQVELVGAGVITSAGEWVSPLGSGNSVTVVADLTRATLRTRSGNVVLEGGSVLYRGSYGIRARRGLGRLTLDGHLGYDLDLARIEVQALSGTIRAGDAQLAGQGPLLATISKQGAKISTDVDAGGGTFELQANGPVSGQDLQVGGGRVDVEGQGTLTATGRIASTGPRGIGIEDVIAGGSLVPTAGTRAEVAGTELRVGPDSRVQVALRGSGQVGADGVRVDGTGSLNARGTIAATTQEGQASATGSADLSLDLGSQDGQPTVEASGPVRASFRARDAELTRDDESLRVGSLDGSMDLQVSLGGEGLRSASGQVQITARDTELEFTTSAPAAAAGQAIEAPRALIVTPEEEPHPPRAVIVVPGEETVTVVKGDTLYALARRFKTSVPELREANGLGLDEILPVGRVLTIPGQEADLDALVAEPELIASAPPPTPTLPAAPTTPAPPAARATPVRQRVQIDHAQLTLDVDDASVTKSGVSLRGTASGEVVVGSAELSRQGLEAKLVGAARASLKPTALTVLRPSQGSLSVGGAEIAVPLRVRLDPGTWIRVPGRVEGQLTQPGSTVTCTAYVDLDASGRLRLDRFEDVEASIETAGLTAPGLSVPEAGFLRFQGQLELLPDGLDLFGEASLGVRGQADEPALSVRW